jgi:hypothetical protein
MGTTGTTTTVDIDIVQDHPRHHQQSHMVKEPITVNIPDHHQMNQRLFLFQNHNNQFDSIKNTKKKRLTMGHLVIHHRYPRANFVAATMLILPFHPPRCPNVKLCTTTVMQIVTVVGDHPPHPQHACQIEEDYENNSNNNGSHQRKQNVVEAEQDNQNNEEKNHRIHIPLPQDLISTHLPHPCRYL